MSEIKTLEVEVTHPDILDVDVDFGQTLTKVVAPEKYLGPFEFYPSDEDQIIPVKEKVPAEDICIKGADGTLEITKNGVYDVINDKTVSVAVDHDASKYSEHTLTLIFDDDTQLGTTILFKNEDEE